MKPGTIFYIVQKAEMATHLLLDSQHGPKAICGTDPGHYLSYSVPGRVTQSGRLEYLDGCGCLHHIDCKRRLALLK